MGSRSTQHYGYLSVRCSYCHGDLYPLSHGEGNYNLYICDCEKAKEELELHPKLDELEKEISEIISNFPKVDYKKMKEM